MRHALCHVFLFSLGLTLIAISPAQARGKNKSVKASKKRRKETSILVKVAPKKPKVKRRAKAAPRQAKAKKSAEATKVSLRKKAIRKAKKSKGRKLGRRKRRRRCNKGKDRFPPMTLFHANFRESLTLRLFDRCGRANRKAPAQMSRFLRCYRTKKRKGIHWRLMSHLYRVSRAFKGRRLIVYSGYRSRKVAKLKHSYHTRGRAIDFRVEGVSRRKLRDYVMKSFKKVGVGFYPNTPFIHMDVRDKRSAFWVDFSSSGEDSRYAKNPYQLLSNDRRGTPMREQRKLWVILPPEKSWQQPRASLAPAAEAVEGAPPAAPVDRVPAPLADVRVVPVAPIPPLPALPAAKPMPQAAVEPAAAPALTARRE